MEVSAAIPYNHNDGICVIVPYHDAPRHRDMPFFLAWRGTLVPRGERAQVQIAPDIRSKKKNRTRDPQR